MRLLTIQSVKNLLHPFQTFILGQKNFAVKIALKKKIPLIFYGENEAEHGNSIADNNSSLRDSSYFTFKNKNLNVQEIENFQSNNSLNNLKFTLNDGVSFSGKWTDTREQLYTVKAVKYPDSRYKFIFYIYSYYLFYFF